MAKNKRNKTEEIYDDEVMVDVIEGSDYKEPFWEKYQNYLIYAVGGLLLIVAAFFAYKFLILAPKEKEAISEMSKAQMRFDQDSFALALENPGEGFSGFLDIADEYSGTKAGNLAKYYAGISYLNLGQFESAIEYLNKYDEDELLTAITKYGAMADAYSELNDMDNAKKYYRKALDQKQNGLLTPYFMYKYAFLLNSEGNKEESSKYFKEIVDEFPESSYARDAVRFIYPPQDEL